METMTEMLRSYVEDTIRKIVDKPEEVRIDVSVSTKTVIVQIKVAENECGKVIGKHGRNINALKTICLAIKNTNFSGDSRHVLLEVLEDENSDFSYKLGGVQVC